VTAARGERVLGRRALNRALLERQHLLRRAHASVTDVIERLVCLQAQAPMPPYQGLHSRIEGFDPHELGRMLTDREVVRILLMRGTLHMATVRDALFLRPLMQAVHDRMYGRVRRGMGERASARLDDAIREVLADGPLGAREIARRLVERGVGHDVVQLGYAVPAFVPLVQLPPRGVWGTGGAVRYATLESWIGREPDREASADELVLRYLAGFGPASVMDLQSWSGLTRMKQVFERLRPRLVTFRDEDGRELFDLPNAPRPDPETPAPVRFLGEYDNVLLGHKNRRRIVPEGFPGDAMLAHGRFVDNLLIDGMLRATWWVERDDEGRATLGVRPFGRLTTGEREEVEAEAERMLAFTDPEAQPRGVRFEHPEG
jgi:Winged helix DNA-binding domain